MNVIGLLNCPITNCPIANCPIITWLVDKWKIGVFLKPIQTRKLEFFIKTYEGYVKIFDVVLVFLILRWLPGAH